jgi:hypothetical protein
MELDPGFLSRLQFAFVISFHIIFPAFTIGLAAWLATIEGVRFATGNLVYRRVFDFWLRCQRQSKIASAGRSKNASRKRFGAIVAWHWARGSDLLGGAERSSPEAAQRRAGGAGLDGERAHRAVMLGADGARRLFGAHVLCQLAGVTSSASGCGRLERRLLWASL